MSTVASKPENAKQNSSQPQTSDKNGQFKSGSDFEHMLEDVTSAVVTYSKRQPKAVACGIFTLGFLIGWKIKPW